MISDFHTHDLQAPAGEAIINLPREILTDPTLFRPRPGALYSIGIHPWWTDAPAEEICGFIGNLEVLLQHEQVIRAGECGLDKLRGASLERQIEIFKAQVQISERTGKPLTIHCVRAYDVLLRLHKAWKPRQNWTVHGFRGRPQLAQQLLSAGLDLSFGEIYNAEAYALTPPERRHHESDDNRSIIR